MRRLVRVVLVVAVLGVLGLVLLVANAHRSLRLVRPTLPQPESVLSFDARADLPSGLYVIETARQAMSRSAVLDPDRDPEPGAPYVMTHPAFVLAWPDGRLFLVDVGMDADSARAFGEPLERFAAAAPIEVLRPVAEQLGPAASRVRGVAFSHLHTDHLAGLAALCDAVASPLPVYQTRDQHLKGNYTTRPGRVQLEAAPCARPTPLDEAPLRPVPGFPGLLVVAAAGHTPGSQILVAHVRGAEGVRTWIFSGDVVNHRDAIEYDLPKPWLYSLLVVPEDGARLASLRAWLADLAADPRTHIAVAHDATGLDVLGAPPWPPFLPQAH